MMGAVFLFLRGENPTSMVDETTPILAATRGFQPVRQLLLVYIRLAQEHGLHFLQCGVWIVEVRGAHDPDPDLERGHSLRG